MLLNLNAEQSKILSAKINEKEWKRLDAILREDTLIVWPIINKNDNRLVLLQYRGGIMEVDVRLVGLDVSDSVSLRKFLNLINKELPLRFRRRVIENSVKKTLQWSYQESQRAIALMWRVLSFQELVEVETKL